MQRGRRKAPKLGPQRGLLRFDRCKLACLYCVGITAVSRRWISAPPDAADPALTVLTGCFRSAVMGRRQRKAQIITSGKQSVATRRRAGGPAEQFQMTGRKAEVTEGAIDPCGFKCDPAP
ncbi:hypothetical protein SAMN04488037_1061 [Shimia marina]|uniref:Uncharacterized protein n=1 Tax=Shimia marina TaxID=321267 RepID=A0A0P1EU73_9RHOB|nr:hypothetical protein SHM7688_03510 [Shimia marina]SFE16109.1 hypothetical protein SAMN04488037_1061 [Shimia marina]